MDSWNKLKKWLSDKVYGEPMDDLFDSYEKLSDEERKNLIKKSQNNLDKSHWKYSLGFTIIYLGLWGFLIWKGLRNGETLYEIMSDEDLVMLYVFGVMLIGFVFFKVKNVEYEDGMG